MPACFELGDLLHDHLHATRDVVVGDEVGDAQWLLLCHAAGCGRVTPDPVHLLRAEEGRPVNGSQQACSALQLTLLPNQARFSTPLPAYKYPEPRGGKVKVAMALASPAQIPHPACPERVCSQLRLGLVRVALGGIPMKWHSSGRTAVLLPRATRATSHARSEPVAIAA